MKILSFGEIIWDVYLEKSHIGGAPLNFAAHAAKQGAESYLVSAIGDDDLGKAALSELDKFGINRDFVCVKKGKSTGKCTVFLDSDGVPSFDLEKESAYDEIDINDGLLSSSFDAVSFGTLAIRNEKSRHSLEKIIEKSIARTVYCDINLRSPYFSQGTVDFALKSCKILKISDTELDYLRNNVLRSQITDCEYLLWKLCEKYENIELVLLTCGERGAYVYRSFNRKIYYRRALPVTVVSTVGAGDSFGAVFLTEYLSGKSIDVCLDRAICISAQVVSREEAVPLDI